MASLKHFKNLTQLNSLFVVLSVQCPITSQLVISSNTTVCSLLSHIVTYAQVKYSNRSQIQAGVKADWWSDGSNTSHAWFTDKAVRDWWKAAFILKTAFVNLALFYKFCTHTCNNQYGICGSTFICLLIYIPSHDSIVPSVTCYHIWNDCCQHGYHREHSCPYM